MGAGASAAATPEASWAEHSKKVLDLDAMMEKYDVMMTEATLLGEGQFGRCYRCTLREDAARRFAVKVVPMGHMKPHQVANLRREILILSAIKDHPSVLHLHDYYEDAVEETAYIVTDLLEGGELFDRILDKVHYSENDARKCVCIMLEVSAWLHARGVCHRDFKPENLILATAADDTSIHVVDFGLAAHVDDKDAMRSQSEQQNGDSISLQHECSRGNAREESIHASSSPREMIARPKISQIEWKTIEI